VQSDAVRFCTNWSQPPTSCSTGVSGEKAARVVLPMWSDWILGLLINLLVLLLVWGTVIAGLILVVREKVEDDDARSRRSTR
jgi:hypothetical protein